MLVSMTKPKFTCFLIKQTNKKPQTNSLSHRSGNKKKGWKVLGQKEDLNAKDGLGHYIERFLITLVDTSSQIHFLSQCFSM